MPEHTASPLLPRGLPLVLALAVFLAGHCRQAEAFSHDQLQAGDRHFESSPGAKAAERLAVFFEVGGVMSPVSADTSFSSRQRQDRDIGRWVRAAWASDRSPRAPRSQALAAITAGLGLRPDRGVTVSALFKEGPIPGSRDDFDPNRESLFFLALSAVVLIGVALVFWLARRLFRQIGHGLQRRMILRQLKEQQRQARKKQRAASASRPTQPEERGPETSTRDHLPRYDPEQAARVVKDWLKDDQPNETKKPHPED